MLDNSIYFKCSVIHLSDSSHINNDSTSDCRLAVTSDRRGFVQCITESFHRRKVEASIYCEHDLFITQCIL